MESQAETALELTTSRERIQDEKKNFFADLERSEDMNDKLQELCDFLKDHTTATGVYIGYLQYPEQTINEDGGEEDHLNTELPKVVKFTHATEDHKYVVGRFL